MAKNGYDKPDHKDTIIMKTKAFLTTVILICTFCTLCAQKTIEFSEENIELANKVTISIDENSENSLMLHAKPGGGIAILKNSSFKNGTIDIELKGENKPGRSFVGIAFNIQNDSTYESIYFRPFNFKSKEKKGNSIQYISQPKNTWRYLRENFKGKYESEYLNPPYADAWFTITLKIDAKSVTVYDKKSNTELLSVKRLDKQASDRIGLWTGHNSNGYFKNVSILE